MNAAAELPVIETLLCHAHVPMASRCLESLRRCHEPAFRLRVRGRRDADRRGLRTIGK